MDTIIKEVLAEIVTGIVTKKFREDTNRKEWALVSRKPDKRTGKRRVLYWFGLKKPGKKRIDRQEKRINYFKHVG